MGLEHLDGCSLDFPEPSELAGWEWGQGDSTFLVQEDSLEGFFRRGNGCLPLSLLTKGRVCLLFSFKLWSLS